MPDFGYEGDNFLVEKRSSSRNWKLMTEIISNPSKSEWLNNHITLRKMKKDQDCKEAVAKR